MNKANSKNDDKSFYLLLILIFIFIIPFIVFNDPRGKIEHKKEMRKYIEDKYGSNYEVLKEEYADRTTKNKIDQLYIKLNNDISFTVKYLFEDNKKTITDDYIEIKNKKIINNYIKNNYINTKLEANIDTIIEDKVKGRYITHNKLLTINEILNDDNILINLTIDITSTSSLDKDIDEIYLLYTTLKSRNILNKLTFNIVYKNNIPKQKYIYEDDLQVNINIESKETFLSKIQLKK